MALTGSAPALRCSCGGTLLVGKDVQPLQAVSMVLDESRCGHKTSVWVWDVSMVSVGFLEKCVAVCLGYCGRGVR
jgi:hypothetical protein